MIQAVFLDAAGTLIHPSEKVGHGYAGVAARFGLSLDPDKVDAAFREAWRSTSPPDYSQGPSTDDDRGWWKKIVSFVLGRCHHSPLEPELEGEIFSAIYSHYAKPEAWSVFPEVKEVLPEIANRGVPMVIVSNFDPRLRGILSGHHLDHYFQDLVISSEIGSYKPDGGIFRKAGELVGIPPSSCLHVGDNPVADLQGAHSAGLQALLLDRPEKGLEEIFKHPNFPT